MVLTPYKTLKTSYLRVDIDMNRDNVHMTIFSELKGRMLLYSPPQHDVLPTEMTPVLEGVVVEVECIHDKQPAEAVY